MKKKCLIILLSLVCVTVCVFGMVACDGNSNDDSTEKHEHTFSLNWQWDDTYHWHVALCEHSDEISGKAEHIIEGDHCSVCGYVSHVHYMEYLMSQEPTCVEDGRISHYHCIECDGRYEDVMGTIPCLNYSVKKLGHNITEYKGVEPTCTQDGWTDYETCSRCSHNTRETLPKLGHNEEELPAIEATCLREGMTVGKKCARCNEEIVRQQKINKKSHDYDSNDVCTTCDTHRPTQGISYSSGIKAAYVKGLGYATGETIYIADTYAGLPVTSIEWEFTGNDRVDTQIKTLWIPSTVTRISAEFIRQCKALEKIVVSQYNDNLCSGDDGIVYHKDFTEIECIPSVLKGDIEIPKSVTSIGSVFKGQKEITSIKFGSQYIESMAFQGCTGLTSVQIYDGAELIGWSAFSGCTSLESINIPNSVTELGSSIFSECSSLSEIEIPDSIIKINSYAFDGCNSLSRIIIPNSVTSIDRDAFRDCDSLTDVTAPMLILNHIPYEALKKLTLTNGERIEANTLTNLKGLTELILSDSVTFIAKSAFSSMTALEKLIIPFVGDESNAYLGYYFEDDNYLNITVPKTLHTVAVSGGGMIGAHAFYNCALQELILGEGVTGIGERAFEKCTALARVVMSDNVTTIEKFAFYGCYKLNDLLLSSNLKKIDQSAFSGCKIETLDLPIGLTYIGDWAFSSCSVSDVTIPDSVTKLGRSAFYDCNLLTTARIGTGINEIEPQLFYGCENLVSLTLPEHITSIGAEAFYENGLTEITLPNEVISVGKNAFYSCTNLTRVVIPISVQSIQIAAFADCVNLADIILEDGVNEIQIGVFRNTAYYNDEVNWSDNVLYIGNYLIQTRDMEITEYTVRRGVVSIANGAFKGCSRLTDIALPDSVRYIGEDSFTDCPIERASIPAVAASVFNNDTLKILTVTSGNIEQNAFNECINLTEVTIGANVTAVDGSAFTSCGLLTSFFVEEGNDSFVAKNGLLYNKSVTNIIAVPKSIEGEIIIPDTVTAIGARMFSDCTKITSLTIGKGVISIGEYAFSGCIKLSGEVNLGEQITFIGNGAFKNCKYIQTIRIYSDIKNIADETFSGCFYLENIYINDNVENIGNKAFYGCNHLITVYIGDKVQSIGEQAFYDCVRLGTIRYSGTSAQWYAIEKGAQYWCNDVGGTYPYKVSCSDKMLSGYAPPR